MEVVKHARRLQLQRVIDSHSHNTYRLLTTTTAYQNMQKAVRQKAQNNAFQRGC